MLRDGPQRACLLSCVPTVDRMRLEERESLTGRIHEMKFGLDPQRRRESLAQVGLHSARLRARHNFAVTQRVVHMRADERTARTDAIEGRGHDLVIRGGRAGLRGGRTGQRTLALVRVRGGVRLGTAAFVRAKQSQAAHQQQCKEKVSQHDGCEGSDCRHRQSEADDG